MLMAYQLKHERLGESDENSLWRCAKRNLRPTGVRGAKRNEENDLLNFQLREIQFNIASSLKERENTASSSRKTKNCQLIQLDGSIGRP